MTESWVEKHRPTDWDEIQGNTTALDEIREWIEDFEPGDPPQLLVGEPGTGKTSAAYVAAEQTGMDFNQINASSARKTEDVRRFASEMRAGDQLVLVDEVDSWHHAVDLNPLNSELRDPQNPVILTANVEYDVPTAIKSPSETHEFKLNTSSRRAKLKEIATKENVPLDEKDLERLVERPDLRSAINDLQLHAEMGLPVEADQREWESSEFEAMDEIIQKGSTENVDVRPPWLVMWLDQNLRKEYEGFEAAAAYDALSRADVYLGGAGAGDYRGWRYAGILAELTADLRLSPAYQGWIRWEFPSWVQSTVPDVEDDDPEAELYRALKGYGEVGFDLSGSYVEFRESVLPILRRLPLEEREQLIVNHTLSEQAAEALDVSSSQYESATVNTEAAEGDGLDPMTGDAMSGDW